MIRPTTPTIITVIAIACLSITSCTLLRSPMGADDSAAPLSISRSSSTQTQAPAPAWTQRKTALNTWNHWHMQGALSVRAGKESAMGRFTWQQNAQQYTLHVRGPLGIGGLHLTGNAQSVTLTPANGKTVHAKNAERLMQQNLGWSVPLAYFRYWVRGLPAPAPAPRGTNAQFDRSHRLTTFTQAGWHITLSGFSAPRPPNNPALELPTHMQFVWPDRVSVTINVQRWR